jgi:hypothetical protein
MPEIMDIVLRGRRHASLEVKYRRWLHIWDLFSSSLRLRPVEPAEPLTRDIQYIESHPSVSTFGELKHPTQVLFVHLRRSFLVFYTRLGVLPSLCSALSQPPNATVLFLCICAITHQRPCVRAPIHPSVLSVRPPTK